MSRIIKPNNQAVLPGIKNYYIILTDKEADWDKIIGRRKTTLDDINHQAEFIWGLFKGKEHALKKPSTYRCFYQ